MDFAFVNVLKLIICFGLAMLAAPGPVLHAQSVSQAKGAEVGFKAGDCSFTLQAAERGLILEYRNTASPPQLLSSRANQRQRSVELLFNCQAQIKSKKFSTGHDVYSTLALRSLGTAFELQFSYAARTRVPKPMVESVSQPQPLLRVLLIGAGQGEVGQGKADQVEAVAAETVKPEPEKTSTAASREVESPPAADERESSAGKKRVSDAAQEGREAVAEPPLPERKAPETGPLDTEPRAEDIALPAPDVVDRLSAERLGVPVLNESLEKNPLAEETPFAVAAVVEPSAPEKATAMPPQDVAERQDRASQAGNDSAVQPSPQELLPSPGSFGGYESRPQEYEPVIWEGQAIAVFVSMLVMFTMCGAGILTWYRTKVVGPREARRQLYSSVSGSTDDISACYALLGLRSSDSTETIRKRYKHLVKVFHADRLSSQQLPEEMLSLANERFQQIQDAYERIKSARGM